MDAVRLGFVPACEWVKLAVERQFRDLEEGPARGLVWVPEAAEDVCEFLELLPHIKGKWAKNGGRIRLTPWMAFIWTTVFGWYVMGPDGYLIRRFRIVYIEVPRKNAKSTIGAGISLYMLAADGEEGPEVYAAATSGDQAKVVYNTAKQMVLKEARLREDCGLEAMERGIHRQRNAGVYRALNAEASTLDGLNPHCATVDEVHAHKSRKLWDVLVSALGARDQPLLCAITTAGSNRAGICYEQHLYVKRLLRGKEADDSYFGIIYTIDKDDDWTDETSWIKANPNFGVSVNPAVLKSECRRAKALSSAQSNFKTKHLDVWVNADSSWMNMRKWDDCGDAPAVETFAGAECIHAMDLASKIDVASRLKLFERDGHVYCYAKHYLPQAAIDEEVNSQYEGWRRDGWLVVTDGNIIDFKVIRADILEDKARYKIREGAYDPFQATMLVTDLQEQGLEMVEVAPNVKNLSEPMKELEALVKDGRFHHDGDPVLAWMISNVVCHRDARDNIYPRKEKPEDKIDGAVALITAISRMLAAPEPEPQYKLEVW